MKAKLLEGANVRRKVSSDCVTEAKTNPSLFACIKG